MSVLTVLVKAAGGLARYERAARQSLRTAGRHCQRAGMHQPQSGAEQQVLAAKDRDVSLVTAFLPPAPFPCCFYSFCLNFEPSFRLYQVNGHHWHLAKTGGDPLRSAGAAPFHGAAQSSKGEEGTSQDHSLLPLSERAVYSTQVSVLLARVLYLQQQKTKIIKVVTLHCSELLIEEKHQLWKMFLLGSIVCLSFLSSQLVALIGHF